MPTENAGPAQGYRKLPIWAWLLAVVTWPVGMFVALAVARVIRWRQSILWTIGTYAIIGPACLAMSKLEKSDPRVRSVVTLACFGLVIAIGVAQYRIGKTRDYWSNQARRIWKIFGITGLVFFIIDTMITVLYFAVPSLTKR